MPHTATLEANTEAHAPDRSRPGKPAVNNVLAMRGKAKITPDINIGREPGQPVRLTRQESEKQRAAAAEAEVRKKVNASQAEAIRARGELKRSQDELALAKREHENEIRQAAERESGLTVELDEVRTQATLLSDKAALYRKLLAVALILAIPAMVWAAANYDRSAARPTVAAVAAVAQKAAAKPADITADTQRLEDAIEHFRNEKPQEVLQRVHAANIARGVSVCSFEWNKGHASLLFGATPGMGIGSAMGDCADAVEQAAK